MGGRRGEGMGMGRGILNIDSVCHAQRVRESGVQGVRSWVMFRTRGESTARELTEARLM